MNALFLVFVFRVMTALHSDIVYSRLFSKGYSNVKQPSIIIIYVLDWHKLLCLSRRDIIYDYP